MKGWGAKVRLYTLAALAVVGSVLLIGWPVLGSAGRRGLLLAGGVALGVQLLSFGVLAALPQASSGFMAAWAGSTLVRFAVVGGCAFWLLGMEEVDLVVALLALAGLFFVLLLMEPWALREREDPDSDLTNG